MTEQEIRRLSRSDVLEMLLMLNKENEKLRAQLDQVEQQAQERSIAINQSGSIAEASLKLNGVFEAAQKACDEYIANVKRAHAGAEDMERQSRERSEAILAEAEKKAGDIVKSAENDAARMLVEATARSTNMVEEARQKAETYWSQVSGKIDAFYASCAGLREILNSLPDAREKGDEA